MVIRGNLKFSVKTMRKMLSKKQQKVVNGHVWAALLPSDSCIPTVCHVISVKMFRYLIVLLIELNAGMSIRALFQQQQFQSFSTHHSYSIPDLLPSIIQVAL